MRLGPRHLVAHEASRARRRASSVLYLIAAKSPEKSLVVMHGPTPRMRPRHTAAPLILLTGTAKPTEAAKKMRIIHLTMRLSCAAQMACERGTLTHTIPAAKAPSRCEPMKGVCCSSPNSSTELMYPKTKSEQNMSSRCTSSRGWIETFLTCSAHGAAV